MLLRLLILINLSKKLTITQKIVKLKKTKNKLKKLNKILTSNKTKHIHAEKKITDLTNKVTQISEKGHNFLSDRM